MPWSPGQLQEGECIPPGSGLQTEAPNGRSRKNCQTWVSGTVMDLRVMIER